MRNATFFLIPFFLSLFFTPIVRFFAMKNGLISYPRADRWHKHPTAILGGIAIYLSVIISSLFFGLFNRSSFGFFLGLTFLFAVGLIDDRISIPPYTKLFMQIIAGAIAIFSGVVIGLPLPTYLVIPLTLLWIVGVTNSFNLLDNIDGLAAGIAAISAGMIFVSSVIFSNNPFGFYALIISGAALGFLPYNFNPAKIFMGDCGSMVLGYSLAVISIGGTARHISNLLITLIVPVLILSVPIFDTLFVMILRKIQNRPIFEGGKDHTSHHLVTLGLSQKKTVLVLYGISIAFGVIAILFSQINLFLASVIAFLAVVILLFFGLFINEDVSRKNELNRVRKPNGFENKTFMNTFVYHKRRIVEVILDFGLIWLAYSSAYMLRFEGSMLNSNLPLLKDSLLSVILIKMSIFFIFGLYRGVWRYVSISDLLTIFKVVSLGSIASILFMTFVFRFHEYSRAVFFLDWILLLFLVCGTRILFRILGEFFSRNRGAGCNVLIFGAGDTGEMVIREIKRNRDLHYKPIGFIDDNPIKKGSKIQGLPVLGTREKIKSLVKENEIKEVLIAVPSLGLNDLSEIVKICNSCGVSYRKIKGILDKEEGDEFEKN
ncbi:MAG: hypothetical protein PHO70_00635 [Candidatus Omnitrophica bacterium]|nr:hypothetical protein [Candidatus Omnitrophota bacterium]